MWVEGKDIYFTTSPASCSISLSPFGCSSLVSKVESAGRLQLVKRVDGRDGGAEERGIRQFWQEEADTANHFLLRAPSSAWPKDATALRIKSHALFYHKEANCFTTNISFECVTPQKRTKRGVLFFFLVFILYWSIAA